MTNVLRLQWIAVAAAAAALTAPSAALAVTRVAALADLSLEQLREVVVSSVARREQRLDRAPAAAYVISGAEIRRSGATTLPEALRLAPMLDVARVDADQYAISARGFNNQQANKMLVLIDGRTVYTPLFSGVFWDAQQMPLDDIDRIEVVAGPGGALWGSNAVNGLIHVFTRSAQQTQGPAAFAYAGNQQRGTDLRWGGGSDSAAWRVHASAWDRSASERADGRSFGDDSDGVQLGFRADWHGDDDALTLQGDLRRATFGQQASFGAPRKAGGAYLLGRWEHRLDADRQTMLQLYWDRATRERPPLFEQRLDTVDAIAQFGLRAGPRHRLLFGAGVREADDDTGNGPSLAFLPNDRRLSWWRLFAQDEIALTETLQLTLSGSAERNPYTGVEWLPSARLAWNVTERHLLWTALSRAVRAPARLDREFFQPATPPFTIAGGPNFDAEVADVIELGLRGQQGASVSYALTGFHHRHRRLRSVAPRPGGAQLENGIEGHARGLSGWASWRAADGWQIDGGGVLLRQQLQVVPGAVDAGGLPALGNDPRHWWSLRSTLALSPRLSWRLALRHTAARPQPAVPSYTALDTRLALRLDGDAEVALAFDNLLDESHPEWGVAGERAEIARAVSLQLRWPMR